MLAKIPPDLQSKVWQKKQEGLTNRKIQAWLQEEHGIEAGIRAVDRLVAKQKDTFKSIATTEYARFAAQSAEEDMNIQQESLAMLRSLRNEVFLCEEVRGQAIEATKRIEIVRKLTTTINTIIMDRANLASTSDPKDEAGDSELDDYLTKLIGRKEPTE